ncbi:MAG: hypothetical protein ABFR62_01735 [Bacteroidota bacterium]
MNAANHLVVVGALIIMGLTTFFSFSYVNATTEAKEEVLYKKLNSIESKINELEHELAFSTLPSENIAK